MIQTWKTGSTISCLWPPRADHAGVPVMLPRKSDSDMCRDGANTANVRFQNPVDEPGRVHGVSDPRHIADLASLSSNRGQLLAMKERWRWRKLRKSGSQIRGQDKSRVSQGEPSSCLHILFCETRRMTARPICRSPRFSAAAREIIGNAAR